MMRADCGKRRAASRTSFQYPVSSISSQVRNDDYLLIQNTSTDNDPLHFTCSFIYLRDFGIAH
jgi:hypothetical protein